MSQLVSFVIPCYRSAKTIGNVVEEIESTMQEGVARTVVFMECSREEFEQKKKEREEV